MLAVKRPHKVTKTKVSKEVGLTETVVGTEAARETNMSERFL